MKEKMKIFVKEFKTFISKGNVLDLAVAVVIGTAFSKIITSIVDDIFMPLIGIILGGINFNNLYFKVGDAVVRYGSFLQSIINFTIIALCIFIVIKIMNKFIKKEEEKAKSIIPSKEEELLTEIRNLLKKQSKK